MTAACPHCDHPHAHELCTLCPGEAHGCPLYASAPADTARETADALTASVIRRANRTATPGADVYHNALRAQLVADVAALAHAEDPS